MLEGNYPQQLSRLLAALSDRITLPDGWDGFFHESGPLSPREDDRRRFVRHHCRKRGVLEIDQSLPAVERSHEFFLIVLRDVSRSGISFLNADELYPGESCNIWTPARRIDARVARCRRAGEHCYIVGARLDGAA